MRLRRQSILPFQKQPLRTVAETQSNYLEQCWAQNLCPYCRKTYEPSQRVGVGQKSKGGFCSLACYAKFYEHDLIQRAGSGGPSVE